MKPKVLCTVYGVKEKEIDVSLIAKSYGGGGHKLAAGFRVTSIENILTYDE